MKAPLFALAGFILAGCLNAPQRPALEERRQPSAESRAVSFLAREVPLWPRENGCFSCHNNGDAARALYAAAARRWDIPNETLEATTRWLADPGQWELNRGNPAYNDHCLARIQFASALAAAVRSGQIEKPEALHQAAFLVAECQQPDGSWQLDHTEMIGSPVTYGSQLLTVMALQILQSSDAARFEESIKKGDRWLRSKPLHNILDAAAGLIAWKSAADPEALAKKEACLELIEQGQALNGGWGPYVSAPPQVFDTALVLLALAENNLLADRRDSVQKGRDYLITMQNDDGGWPETTRPPGAESYAQRISTTGWATLALLATSEAIRPGL